MMAKEPDSDCSCVVDTFGLLEIATASANLKGAFIARLEDGTIGVPSWAWQEFQRLYEDEAASLSKHIVKRIAFSQHVHVRAAAITEELRLGFSLGAYDDHIELYTASVAINKHYTVLTSANNISAYDGMNCPVKELAVWIEEMGD
jgi:hypothetical protein